MKLGRCEAWNFGSYSHIELDLADQGLGLIYGKTGSGKSTIPDIPCWTLFGITAKNGTADEVRSWQSPNEPTKAVLNVRLSQGAIEVTRIRGKAGQNDLYWIESSTPDKKERGKDLVETQRHLCSRLGVDASLYLSASYFCDFSPSGQFFVAKAKDRRELFEKIASLDFPVSLAEKLSGARKAAKIELEQKEIDLAKCHGKLEQMRASLHDLEEREAAWSKTAEDRVNAANERLVKAKHAAKAVPALGAKIQFITEELKELNSLLPEVDKARIQTRKIVLLLNL